MADARAMSRSADIQQKFRLKMRTPPEIKTIFPSSNNSNLTFEILKIVKKLAASQEEFQSYVSSELLGIHEKIDNLLEKFNSCILEPDNDSSQRKLKQEHFEEGSIDMQQFEQYDDSQEERLDEDLEGVLDQTEQNEELEELEHEQEEEQIHDPKVKPYIDINPDNMISLLYDRKTHEIHIEDNGEDANDAEENNQISLMLVPKQEEKPKKPRVVSERYIPKIEKKSNEENPYMNATADQLLALPINTVDHLEVIENVLKNETIDNLAFREELINLIQQHTPSIHDPSKVVEEISKSCFRQIVTDEVLQFFCWTNKFPKQYPFLSEMKNYVFFSDIIYISWKRIFPDRIYFENAMKKVIRGTRIRYHLNRRRTNARLNKSAEKNVDVKPTVAEELVYMEV